jgi:hypothetical protein
MKIAEIIQDVSLNNYSARPIKELALIVEPNRFFNGFELYNLTVSDRPAIERYGLEGNLLTIPIDPPIEPGMRVTVHLEYRLNLPEIPPPSDTTKPQVYGYTDRQTNLVDWFPLIPPIDKDGNWIIHEPSYFGEYLVYPLADFDLELTLNNTGRPLVVAASSLGNNQDNVYGFSLKNARNFVISMSPDYQVAEIQEGDLTILSYFYPLDAAAGNAVLTHTQEAARLYSDLFGNLPRQSISVVEADFLDGMEFDGLYFLSRGFYNLFDGSPKGYLTAISVHETAHQWWYASVANDQALEPWLDEAFSTYAERLYYEKYYPELVSWWWSYRVDFYDPSGKIDLPVYEYQGFWIYRNAVYLNGARFLESLRSTLGDETFFEILKSYFTENQGKIATGSDFWSLLRDKNGKDFSELIEQYFETNK